MTMGVGVIGAGTVGGGVIETLLTHSDAIQQRAGVDVSLVHAADRDVALLGAYDLGSARVSDDAQTLIDDPNVDVVVELIGGLEPARTFILAALNAGKHVVTANKMLLAVHGAELCRAAVKNGVDLRYEASVAGGIPIIKALREGLAANRIQFVYGILNGTCNYILSRMTYEQLEFSDVLEQAVEKGFAETPPDLDIEGHDTAHKCQIIASLCFSTEVALDDIHVEGITKVTHFDVKYAMDMGYVIKLLAVVRDDEGQIEARVHPTLIPREHLLASVRNEFNAIYVQADVVDATLYYGRGAGRFPTASAVLGDIVDIARRGKDATISPPFYYGPRRTIRSMGEIESRYFLRLTTRDQPGVLGTVCTILGAHGVSIASVIQHEEHSPDAVHVVLMTHETRESSLRDALAKIDSHAEFIQEPTHVLRVLQES